MILHLFRFVTPAQNYNGSTCITFDYHMYGSQMGKLHIYIRDKNKQRKIVKTYDGEYGNKWFFDKVDIYLNRDSGQQVGYL